MRRFFVPDLDTSSDEASIEGEELRHLRVLRLERGDPVTLLNGRGLERSGVLLSVGRHEAVVRLGPAARDRGESCLDITLICGLIKAQKPDLIVQKTTELGVKSIIFYRARRSVPSLRDKARQRRLVRWRAVALGAVKQCRRSRVPSLDLVPCLSEAIGALPQPSCLLFFDEMGGLPLSEAIQEMKDLSPPPPLALLIGPEGGFTGEERTMVLEKGFRACSLGPRVLRAETAAIVATALVQEGLGDI